MESPLSIRQAICEEANANGVSFCACPESVEALLQGKGLAHLAPCRPLLESVRCEVPSDLMHFRGARLLLRYFYLPELAVRLQQRLGSVRREQIDWILETWIMALGLTPFDDVPYPGGEPSVAKDAHDGGRGSWQ